MQAHRVRPFPLPTEPWRILPLVLVSLFTAVAAVDLLLIVQPPLLQALRDSWQRAMSATSLPTSWGTLLAASIAVGGISIAAALLSTFIRGVQTAPYLWLAPILIGSCMFVMGTTPVTLPLSIPGPMFAVVAALLVIGGGALFRTHAAIDNAAGTLLVATPLVLIASGYLRVLHTAEAARYAFDGHMQLFVVLLWLASVGAPLLAIASRRAAVGGDALVDERSDVRDRRPRATSTSTQRLTWGVGAAVVAGLAWAYFGSYAPLQQRLVSQLELQRTQSAQQAQLVSALRANFERERRGLIERLAGARTARLGAEAQAAQRPKPAPVEPPAAAKRETVPSKRASSNHPLEGLDGM